MLSKEAFYLLFFILLCGAIFYFQLEKTGDRYDDLAVNGVSTTGVVRHVYKGIEYSYDVKNKEYESVISSYPRDIVDGEKYVVLFDPNDPARSIIDFYEPVYDTISYLRDCATSFRKINGGDRGLVNYRYEFAGQEYDRFQRFTYNGVSEWKELEIYVNKENPGIAYLTGKKCDE